MYNYIYLVGEEDMVLEKVFNYFVKGLIILFLGIIIVCNIINENLVERTSNIGIIIVSFIILVIYCLLNRQKAEKKNAEKDISRKVYLIIVFAIFLLVIIFQKVLVKNFYFITGWDVSNLYYFGKNFVETRDLNQLGRNGAYVYLSVYPNNLFLCRLYVITAMYTRGLELYKVLLSKYRQML